MTKYIDLESIKEIRKMLGLDNLIISKGTLSYILDSIKDLYNNLDLNESYASKASYFLYRITKDIRLLMVIREQHSLLQIHFLGSMIIISILYLIQV